MCDAFYFGMTAYGIDLILHQCDEWTHDDRGTFGGKRRQLITKALPATSGHNHKSVLAAGNTFYDGALVSFKLRKAEKILELVFPIH